MFSAFCESLMKLGGVKSALELRPIGYIKTKMVLKFDAPSQPDRSCTERSVVELLPDQNFEQALQDLPGFDYIWLIWWFHRNSTWRPKVLPPRGVNKKRGVFATRSPHRPNPIGITAVPLLKISGRQLLIGSCDLLDGTPILDIKPYISSIDSIPSARTGWLSEIELENSQPPVFEVQVSAQANEQLDWLKARGIDIALRAFPILRRNPWPHRTRRITKCADNKLRMGCGAWRLIYSVIGNKVLIDRVCSGYPLRSLKTPGNSLLPHREALLLFEKRWGTTPSAQIAANSPLTSSV